MSDARAQDLQRRIAEGDPSARAELFKHCARTGDPSLEEAARLRTQLRSIVFRILDQTPKASHVPFAPVVGALAAALESRATETCGFAFRSLGQGPWHERTTSALGVLVACLGDRVLIGLGGTTAGRRGATPGSIWHELSGVQIKKHRPATSAPRIEAWALFEERRDPTYMCWDQEVVETTRAVVSDLCRYEAYAGPTGYALWAELEPDPLRDPSQREQKDRPLSQADAEALAEHLQGLGPSDRAALLQEFVGHQDPSGLTRPESKHLLSLLQAWTGTGDELSEEDLLRVRGRLDRLGLSEVRLTHLLNEVAGVNHLVEVRQAQLDSLLRRLEELGSKEGGPSAPTAGPRRALGPWLDVPRDDSLLEGSLAELEPTRAREVGAQWHGRIDLAARYADVAPIRAEPTLRWRTKIPGREVFRGLVASPLGVVALSKKRTVLLCPESGALRAELPRAGNAFFVAEVLVLTLARRALGGFDSSTGELLWRAQCATRFNSGQLRRDLFLTESGADLKGYRFTDPRSGPEEAWKAKADASLRYADVRGLGAHGLEDGFQGLLLSDGHVVTFRGRERGLQVLSAAGEPLHVVEGESPLLADREGFVSSPEYLNSEYRRPITVGSFEFASGKCFWELETLGLPIALTPDSVYFIDRGRLVERSRRLGTITSQTGDDVPVEAIRSDVFACRDVVLIARRRAQEIEAYAAGERLWTYHTKKKVSATDPPFPKLAPGHERLYALIGQREVVCLGVGEA